MVIVHWTAIEQIIKCFAHGMTNESDPEDQDRRLFDATRSMQKRIQLWEDLVKKRMRTPSREALLKIINEIKQVEDQRDKIVHGVWGDKENSNEISAEAHGVFSWGNPGPNFNWKLTYDSILKVALRIDQLHSALFDFVAHAGGKTGATQFTFGETLRSLSEIPTPSRKTS